MVRKFPNFITTTEAAAMMRVSPETIRRLCEAGEIAAVKLSPTGHWRIDRDKMMDKYQNPSVEADDAFLQSLRAKRRRT